MKIIALDMDGVLNCKKFRQDFYDQHGGKTPENKIAFHEKYELTNGVRGFIVPELLDRLNNILEKTDSYILWSSSWRMLLSNDEYRINRFWRLKGLPLDRLIGTTPGLGITRHKEIYMWIIENQIRDSKIAILDDNSDAWSPIYLDKKEFKELNTKVKFFQTTPELGLTAEIATAVEQFLSL